MHLERFGFGFLLALGLVASPVLAEEDDHDEKVDLAKVPAAVKKAADHAAPGVKWESASKEKEKGKTVYEIKGDNAKGRDVEVSITEDGMVLEVETETPMSEVPEAVTHALKAKMPKFKPEEIESVAKGGKIVGYEFEGDDEKGQDIEVFVSTDGKIIKVEKAEEDEDDEKGEKGEKEKK